MAETQNESRKETEDKVRSVITKKLHLNCSWMEIECSHRSGNTSGYSGKRPIVIKFLRHKDKMTVLGKAKELKGTSVYMNDKYSEGVKQKHREFIPAMKAAREQGDIVDMTGSLFIPPPRMESEPSSLSSLF